MFKIAKHVIILMPKLLETSFGNHFLWHRDPAVQIKT